MSQDVVRRILVSGRVQGVGFRYALADVARECSVTGWVRNRRDGRVEALLAGTAEAVDRVIGWARQGPPAAKVSAVEVEPATGSFDNFEIAATA
jgi:acylphosphatase